MNMFVPHDAVPRAAYQEIVAQRDQLQHRVDHLLLENAALREQVSAFSARAATPLSSERPQRAIGHGAPPMQRARLNPPFSAAHVARPTATGTSLPADILKRTLQQVGPALLSFLDVVDQGRLSCVLRPPLGGIAAAQYMWGAHHFNYCFHCLFATSLRKTYFQSNVDLYVQIVKDGSRRDKILFGYSSSDRTSSWEAKPDGVHLRFVSWISGPRAAAHWQSADCRVDVAILVAAARRIVRQVTLEEQRSVYDDARDSEFVRPRTALKRWATKDEWNDRATKKTAMVMEIEYSRAMGLDALSRLMATMPHEMHRTMRNED